MNNIDNKILKTVAIKSQPITNGTRQKGKIIAWSLVTFFLPIFAAAQVSIKDASDRFTTLSGTGIVNIFLSLARWFLAAFGIIAVIVAIYAAFLFVIGGDNEDKTTQAKKTLIYAVIGVGVAIVSFSIVLFTQSLLFTP